VIRTLALTESTTEGNSLIHVAIRSEADGFRENYCEAEYYMDDFALSSLDLQPCPPITEPLPLKPDDFSPVPLFQGKFFRWIMAIYKLEPEKETICTVHIPEGVQYFRMSGEQSLVTVSPAARDAFFQSGAIGLPSGFLPSQIGKAFFYRKVVPGSDVICWTQLVTRSKLNFVPILRYIHWTEADRANAGYSSTCTACVRTDAG